MRLVRPLLARGTAIARPAAKAIGRSALAANRGGPIAVLPGDAQATGRVVEITGAARGAPTPTGLLIFAAVPHADLAAGAKGLGDHRRSGGRVLALIIGSSAQRRRIERSLIAADPDISAATVAHLNDLGDPAAVLGAVRRVLGDQRLGAAKAVPELRESVSQGLIAVSARRAAIIAATPALAPIAMPVLTGMQLGLVADLSNANARPINGRLAGQTAGVMASSFAWREVARRLSRRAPSAAPAIRAGVAYSATRAVGLSSALLGATNSRSSKGES